VASQKFTIPGVAGIVPAVTAAVRVTTVPAVTVATGLSPLVTVRVTVVAVCAKTAPLKQNMQVKAQAHMDIRAQVSPTPAGPPTDRAFLSRLREFFAQSIVTAHVLEGFLLDSLQIRR
jgi:hypothetical protein